VSFRTRPLARPATTDSFIFARVFVDRIRPERRAEKKRASRAFETIPPAAQATYG
jgi:hypothetical protein